MIEQKCPSLACFCFSPETAANLLLEVHYALLAHAHFQKNSCARINNKKRNFALSVGHFKHITNNPVSSAKYSNILSIKFTDIQVLRIFIL